MHGQWKKKMKLALGDGFIVTRESRREPCSCPHLLSTANRQKKKEGVTHFSHSLPEDPTQTGNGTYYSTRLSSK